MFFAGAFAPIEDEGKNDMQRATHAGPAATADASPAKPMILVVEDDAAVRDVIRITLEEEGYAVQVACDGMEAVGSATTRRPELIVLDWGLPGLNGGGVATAVREAYGRGTPPIVLVSAESALDEKAQAAGACAFVRKPFDLEDLVSTVEGALRAG